MQRLIAALVVSLVSCSRPSLALMVDEARYPIERSPFSLGDTMIGLLVIGAGWVASDIAYRRMIGRAPTLGQRIIWTALLIIAGASIVGIIRRW